MKILYKVANAIQAFIGLPIRHKDKVLHALVSAALTALFIAAASLTMMTLKQDVLLAAGLAFAGGIVKELWDKVTMRGTPDKLDVLANCVGIAIVSILTLLIF